jgi:hypothetical protein
VDEISDHTYPYEILLRFDESGALAGAHKVDRRRVMLNGEVINDEVGPAKSIAIDDASQPGGLWSVLGEALTLALVRTAEQEAEIAALNQRLAEASAA